MSVINTNCPTFKCVIKNAYRADIHTLKVDFPWKTKDYPVSFFSYINHYIVEKPQSLLIILSVWLGPAGSKIMRLLGARRQQRV